MLDQFKKHSHWTGAESVCKALNNAGFKAYLAGGCVRDALLKRKINDFDIATDATPEQVLELFPKALKVGLEFGTVVVVFKGPTAVNYQIEVTSFRSDGRYVDGRRPEGVEFSTPAGDAERRDFTVNALFYSYKEQKVIDFLGGLKDLKNKKLKAAGQAELRFKEDHLRVLRGFRFAAQLDFKIDPLTLGAMKASVKSLKDISKERTRVEVDKLFKGRYSHDVIDIVLSSGLWEILFPGFQFYKNKKLWDQFKYFLDADIANLNLIFAVIYKLQFKFDPNCSIDSYIDFLKDSKCSNKFLKHLKNTLIGLLNFTEQNLAGQIKILGSSCGAEVLQLLSFFSALPEHKLSQSVKSYLVVSDDAGALPENFVTANDLMDLGYKGRELGAMLESLYDLQLVGEVTCRREALMRASASSR